MLALASWLDGFIEADPTIAAILIGAVAVSALAYTVLRLAGRDRKGPR